MRTTNPKIGMLTEMEHVGSKVISRKSTGYKIPKKDWNQKTLSVNPRIEGSQEINDYIIKRLNRPKGLVESKEDQCAVQFMRQEMEIQRKMGTLIESSYIKYDTILKNFEFICERFMGGKISFNDLRNFETIEKIITYLKINKNPKKKNSIKKNKTIFNYMSVFATFVNKWNKKSRVHYPINTQTFFYEIGKSNIKLATSLSEEEFNKLKNYEPKGRSDYEAQIKAKSIFLFQYYCGGIRISDALLLTNKQFRDNGVHFHIIKTGQNVVFPFHFSMAKTISPFYKEDFNELVNSTTLGEIVLSIEIMKNLMTLDIDEYKELNLEDIISIKNQLVVQMGEQSEIVSSMNEIQNCIEYEIAKRFFNLISSKPIHLIFPYLKWEDFSAVHNNSRLFNEEHCRLISLARNKHNRNLNTISESIGLPKLGGHTPRHTLSTHANKWGYSIAQIQSVLVHTNPLTTARYLRERHPDKLLADTMSSLNDMIRTNKLN